MSGQPATARVGLVQLRATLDIAGNIEAASAGIADAAARGCTYVQTPENTTLMAIDRAQLLERVQPGTEQAAITTFAGLARQHGVWLHIGSLPVAIPLAGAAYRLANRSLVFSPAGEIAAAYDKIHLFDVDLGTGESYRESATFQPGDAAVIADLPFGRLGLTICYDLRFPQLYRTLAHAGATLLAVPAAFTAVTGIAHWHVLLRARAIENGAFVLAAAQGGLHANGRRTFGHSLIVDPWGRIVAEAGEEPGVTVADLDLAVITHSRGRIPSLQHDRAFAPPRH